MDDKSDTSRTDYQSADLVKDPQTGRYHVTGVDLARSPNPQPRARPHPGRSALALVGAVMAMFRAEQGPKLAKLAPPPGRKMKTSGKVRRKGNGGAWNNRLSKRRASNRVAKCSRRRNRSR